jgi:hypothetical protein
MKKLFSIVLALVFTATAAFGAVAAAPATAQKTYSYVMFKDDGAAKDKPGALAYMGSKDNGNDKSMTVELVDTTTKLVGESSSKFTYTPSGTQHWAGIMCLYEEGKYTENPGAKGPDLSKATKMVFYVKGKGGNVKFFVECDGKSDSQSAKVVELGSDWKKVTLELKDDWKYCNIPFGWACSQEDLGTGSSSIEFWVDGIHFA